jgi:molybdate transport system substrate-binding protein
LNHDPRADLNEPSFVALMSKVAFGANRTSTGRQNGRFRSGMTRRGPTEYIGERSWKMSGLAPEGTEGHANAPSKHQISALVFWPTRGANMMFTKFAAALTIAFATAMSAGGECPAAEITAKVADPLTVVIGELVPRFERQTGHKVVVQLTPGPVVKRNIDAGEPFDVAITITPAIDALFKDGKLAPGSQLDVAYSGIGVGIKQGARKPDISSVEAFKRTLLEAKSVAHAAQGQSGIYFRSLLERLGIAEEMRPKLKPLPPEEFAPAIASGETEILVVTIPLIINGTAELVGPIPAGVQFYNSFSAGISTASKEPDTAAAFLRLLTSVDVAPVYRTNGLEPGAPKK